MRKLIILITLCTQTAVECHQYQTDELYQRLSDRIYYDTKALQRKHAHEIQELRELLNKLDEKIDSTDSNINKRIDSVESEITSVASEMNEKLNSLESRINEKLSLTHSKLKEDIDFVRTDVNLSGTSKSETVESKGLKNSATKASNENELPGKQLENIRDQVSMIRTAFKKEKTHVRNLLKRTNLFTERINNLNETVMINKEARIKYDNQFTEYVREHTDSIESQLKDLEAKQERVTERLGMVFCC